MKHKLKPFTKPGNLAGKTSVAEPETMTHRLKVHDGKGLVAGKNRRLQSLKTMTHELKGIAW
jgi:hypothetical protein